MCVLGLKRYFFYLFNLLELRVGFVRESFQVVHAELGFSQMCNNCDTIIVCDHNSESSVSNGAT